MSAAAVKHPSSYRDPSGYIFEKEGVLYRQVNLSFKEDFDHFIKSGCYNQLVEKKLLLSHQVINENFTGSNNWYTTLQPDKINFISYPYEWSFDMLKDAALLTLQLIKETIPFGVVLKDATPYNIQWHNGQLIFIDTLSFEKYNEAQPWIAYRQFCESFLGPLLLMHYNKLPLQQLSFAYPDGIPLAVTKALLPGRSRFSLYTYLHIHLHAKVSGNSENAVTGRTSFTKQKLLNLISSLETLIKKLKLPRQASIWSAYYKEAAQRNDYLEQKKKIINEWLQELPDIKTAADLGANEGEFTQLLAARNILSIAADFDPYCINTLYNKIKSGAEKNIQPLIIDLSNPSPAVGVNNNERQSFTDRCNADLVLALALIHHLAIGKNIPLEMIAGFLKNTGNYLIIELIPKDDEKVQLMLKSKEDIYTNYTEGDFIKSFEQYYSITDRQFIGQSGRQIFLMKRKDYNPVS